jgi:hypothetical protein
MTPMKNLLRVTGQLALLALLAASGPCSDKAPARSALAPEPEPPATQAPPQTVHGPQPQPKGTVVVPNGPYAKVLQTVDELAALPQLSKVAAESHFRVPMTHLPHARPTDQYYEALLPSGPFSRVEVRESNPTQDKFEFLILDIRPDPALTIRALLAVGRLRPDTAIDVNPDVPPEGTITYITRDGGQTVSYEFRARSEQLSGVVLERHPGG